MFSIGEKFKIHVLKLMEVEMISYIYIYIYIYI
jgi:hypothetical protein